MSCQLLTHSPKTHNYTDAYPVTHTKNECNSFLIHYVPKSLMFSEHSSLASRGVIRSLTTHPQAPGWAIPAPGAVKSLGKSPPDWKFRPVGAAVPCCGQSATFARGELESMTFAASLNVVQVLRPAFSSRSLLALLVCPDVCCRFFDVADGLIRMVTRVHIQVSLSSGLILKTRWSESQHSHQCFSQYRS